MVYLVIRGIVIIMGLVAIACYNRFVARLLISFGSIGREMMSFYIFSRFLMEHFDQTKNYAFILDLASGTSVLYASDKNDVSDDVLDQLGNVMQTVRRENRRKANAAPAGGAGGTKGGTSGGSKTAPVKPKK